MMQTCLQVLRSFQGSLTLDERLHSLDDDWMYGIVKSSKLRPLLRPVSEMDEAVFQRYIDSALCGETPQTTSTPTSILLEVSTDETVPADCVCDEQMTVRTKEFVVTARVDELAANLNIAVSAAHIHNRPPFKNDAYATETMLEREYLLLGWRYCDPRARRRTVDRFVVLSDLNVDGSLSWAGINRAVDGITTWLYEDRLMLGILRMAAFDDVMFVLQRMLRKLLADARHIEEDVTPRVLAHWLKDADRSQVCSGLACVLVYLVRDIRVAQLLYSGYLPRGCGSEHIPFVLKCDVRPYDEEGTVERMFPYCYSDANILHGALVATDATTELDALFAELGKLFPLQVAGARDVIRMYNPAEHLDTDAQTCWTALNFTWADGYSDTAAARGGIKRMCTERGYVHDCHTEVCVPTQIARFVEMWTPFASPVMSHKCCAIVGSWLVLPARCLHLLGAISLFITEAHMIPRKRLAKSADISHIVSASLVADRQHGATNYVSGRAAVYSMHVLSTWLHNNRGLFTPTHAAIEKTGTLAWHLGRIDLVHEVFQRTWGVDNHLNPRFVDFIWTLLNPPFRRDTTVSVGRAELVKLRSYYMGYPAIYLEKTNATVEHPSVCGVIHALITFQYKKTLPSVALVVATHRNDQLIDELLKSRELNDSLSPLHTSKVRRGAAMSTTRTYEEARRSTLLMDEIVSASAHPSINIHIAWDVWCSFAIPRMAEKSMKKNVACEKYMDLQLTTFTEQLDSARSHFSMKKLPGVARPRICDYTNDLGTRRTNLYHFVYIHEHNTFFRDPEKIIVMPTNMPEVNEIAAEQGLPFVFHSTADCDWRRGVAFPLYECRVSAPTQHRHDRARHMLAPYLSELVHARELTLNIATCKEGLY